MEVTLNLESPNIPEPLSEAMKLEDYEFDQRRLQYETEFLKVILSFVLSYHFRLQVYKLIPDGSLLPY